MVASTVFGAGFLAWDAYGQTVARYQQGANILGIVLAEQTTRYVQVTDRVLQELQRRVGTLNIHGVEDFQARVGTLETHNLLRDSMQNLPPGNAFLLIDAQGHIASSSRSLAEKGEDLSDVDYFRYLMATDDAKVTVSRTRMGKITGKPTIFVARRINTSDGDFLGVAVAAIDVLDLSRFHHAINKLPGQALTLLRRDGSVLTRDPDPLQFAGSGMPAESPWHNLVQAGGGTYRSPGFLGGEPAIVSVYPLSAYPLVVDVSIREYEVFAGWRHEVRLIGVAVVGVLILCVILFRQIDQQFLRLSEQNAALQRTAAALRDSEHVVAEKSRMLETTLEHMDQGLMMIDSERRVPICNRRAIELLDLPPALVATCPKFEDLLSFQQGIAEFSERDDEFQSFVKHALLLDGPRIYERRRPNGRVLEVRTTPLPDGEAVRTFTDVTVRHEALESLAAAKEQAEAANRAKSEFLANMSHELRTPLNAIIGFSELMREQTVGPLSAKYISFAEDIHEGGQQLLALINDLLNFSKIDAGSHVLTDERVDLASMLHVCQRSMAKRAAAANVRIICDPGAKQVTLWIDGRAVKQVLLNLLDNAIKFSPGGGTVNLQIEEATGGVAVRVVDTGIGIEPSVLSTLFEPFRQADNSTRRKFGGSGLGLAISSSLMRLMGGNLEINSEPGVGTAVTAMLPAVRVVGTGEPVDTLTGQSRSPETKARPVPGSIGYSV